LGQKVRVGKLRVISSDKPKKLAEARGSPSHTGGTGLDGKTKVLYDWDLKEGLVLKYFGVNLNEDTVLLLLRASGSTTRTSAPKSKEERRGGSAHCSYRKKALFLRKFPKTAPGLNERGETKRVPGGEVQTGNKNEKGSFKKRTLRGRGFHLQEGAKDLPQLQNR